MKKPTQRTTYFKVVAGNNKERIGQVYECAYIDKQVVWLKDGADEIGLPLQFLIETYANGRKVRNDKGQARKPVKLINMETIFDTATFEQAKTHAVKELCKAETVDSPVHYGGKDNPYEAIKVIEAWGLDFCLGNVAKYISRAGKKDKSKELEDLRKASWYLNRKIEQLENQ